MGDIYVVTAIRNDDGETIKEAYSSIMFYTDGTPDDRIMVIKSVPSWHIGFLYLHAFKKIEIRKNGKFFWSYTKEN